jgi:hypothetical protein
VGKKGKRQEKGEQRNNIIIKIKAIQNKGVGD